MRLSCPGCGAVYEAPIASIGPAGRLVECGACGRRWRAFPPAQGAEAPPDDEPAPPPPAIQPTVIQPPAPPPVPALLSAPSRAAAPAPATAGDAPPRSGGAFMAGFALAASAALIAMVVYARHDGLAAAAPALTDPLTAYADWVDARREDLRLAVEALRARIGG